MKNYRTDELVQEAIDFEMSAGHLVKAVADWLDRHPGQCEHIRSRILSKAATLSHMEGSGALADEIVRFQCRLADGDGSYHHVASLMLSHRRKDVYSKPSATETILLAYLDADKKLDATQINKDLLCQYRYLITGHTRELAEKAILAGMDNLIQWLDQLPQDHEARESKIEEVVRRARIQVPWEELDVGIRRHLEAHLELLPGTGHPEDILRLLIDSYDTRKGETVFIRGMRLLQRLPLVRTRSEELEELVTRLGRRQRSQAAWKAVIDLLEGLITGMEELVYTREKLEKENAKRIRILEQFLVHDKRLRDLLYRIATDFDQDWSVSAEKDKAIRKIAWRALLRCLPANRIDLIEQGLLDYDGLFFFTTVRECADAFQRELLDRILHHWNEVFPDSLPEEERREKMASVS